MPVHRCLVHWMHSCGNAQRQAIVSRQRLVGRCRSPILTTATTSCPSSWTFLAHQRSTSFTQLHLVAPKSISEPCRSAKGVHLKHCSPRPTPWPSTFSPRLLPVGCISKPMILTSQSRTSKALHSRTVPRAPVPDGLSRPQRRARGGSFTVVIFRL